MKKVKKLIADKGIYSFEIEMVKSIYEVGKYGTVEKKIIIE